MRQGYTDLLQRWATFWAARLSGAGCGPRPDFSVNKPRKIRLSAMGITKNEVAVYGVAATVGDYF